MGMNQINLFLARLRDNESKGSYSHFGEDGERLGAYGISPANWRRWTAQYGLTGAPWQNKSAQDSVAHQKVAEYYNRYGNWELVALAWWGGTEYADEIANEGIVAQAEFGPEAIELTVGLRSASLAPGSNAPKPASDLPQSDAGQTQLTSALKATGHIQRADQTAVEGSEMHRLMAPILQGYSNSIRSSAGIPDARGEGIPSGSAGSTTTPAAGSTTASGGDY